jgi:enamine deaminase RidA (YjgF/YER057c/UK114 family)
MQMTNTGGAGQGILPAPGWRRSGDFVFVSSIYPVDGEGNAVHSPSTSPYTGESEAGAQTRAVLEDLKARLAEAGTTLDRMVKAEVYLADPADFVELKQVWREYFPTDPPARVTAVVGEDHIIPGARLNLHGVALAGDSAYRKETISVADAPDPLAAEHAPQAVKAGPFVFPSALPATDFENGIVVGKNARLPYYGNDAELQANYVFDQLERVLKAAGSGLDQAIKSQLYEVDLGTFHDVDRVWGARMPIPPPRSSMAMRGLLVPGAVFVPNLVFLAPDDQHQKRETREGIRWHPVDLRKVNFTPGILAGDWLMTAGQCALPDYKNAVFDTAPEKLPWHFSDIEIQTESTMGLLLEQLEGNGMGLGDIVDAKIFLVNPHRDYRGFERTWRRLFDGVGQMPSMSIVPSVQANGKGGIMVNELIIEIDLISRKEGGT